MPTQVIMPALGLQQDTGTLVAWLKVEGESVSQGEPIMEIETDKATVEIESPASGILAGVCARPGDEVPVGQVVAYILAPGETVPSPTAATKHGVAPSGPGAPPTASPALARLPAERDRPREPAGERRATLAATPVARRLAEQKGVDLALVQAWDQPAGLVTRADVIRYLGALGTRPALPAASPMARRLARERGLEVERLAGKGPRGAVLAADVPLVRGEPAPHVLPEGAVLLQPSSRWQSMADRVSRSWTSAPHFFLLREANASRLVEVRAAAQQLEPAITYTDLLVKLTAIALSRHPRVNASWDAGRIILHSEINVGIAVAIPDGLVVPVIRRANELSLGQIAAGRQALISRAESNKLTVADLADGTFTVSNLGMYAVDAFLAVLNPPQAAILAVGRIAERVVAVGGRPAVQPVMTLSLSFDHRVVDGARGAEFLNTLTQLIEEPPALL